MSRPKNYLYPEILLNHLGGDTRKLFNGEAIYPRQLEVHLPADGVRPCNFKCFYCQGRDVPQDLGRWEPKGLRLMEQLEGKIPYYIYGGVYTEPLMNPYLPRYLEMTKRFGNNFGIHTNGSLFTELEEREGLCSLIDRIADSPLDYVSVSLDGGTVESHSQTKNVKEDWFTRIIEGIRILARLRGGRAFPSLRVCYLMNRFNSSPEEIAGIVKIFQEIGVDSLRFSVPYHVYGVPFEKVRKYRENFEIPFGEKCAEIVKPHVSKSFKERPYVFWHPPSFQDVEKMNFRTCIYSYYQITLAADGWIYKCSSTAAPNFPKNRIMEITDDLGEFQKAVLANHDPSWNAHTCFQAGARCNRIALEINETLRNGDFGGADAESVVAAAAPPLPPIAPVAALAPNSAAAASS